MLTTDRPGWWLESATQLPRQGDNDSQFHNLTFSWSHKFTISQCPSPITKVKIIMIGNFTSSPFNNFKFHKLKSNYIWVACWTYGLYSVPTGPTLSYRIYKQPLTGILFHSEGCTSTLTPHSARISLLSRSVV